MRLYYEHDPLNTVTVRQAVEDNIDDFEDLACKFGLLVELIATGNEISANDLHSFVDPNLLIDSI